MKSISGLVIIVGLALHLKTKDADCIKELNEDGYHFIAVDGFDNQTVLFRAQLD